MKRVLGFYRQALQTINPGSYDGFAESKAKNTGNYFAALTFNAFVLMLIVLAPTLIQLPTVIDSYFGDIQSLTFNTDFETKTPLLLPKENPVLLISSQNETPSTPAKVVFHNGKLYYGFLLNQYEFDFTKVKDAKANSSGFSSLLAAMLILMAPTLLLIFYVYAVIKYAVIILGAAIIARILSELVRYRVSFTKLLNCAVYGSTLTIFADMIFFALGFKFYYIQYLPLAIFLIVAISQNGEKLVSEKNRKYVEVK